VGFQAEQITTADAAAKDSFPSLKVLQGRCAYPFGDGGMMIRVLVGLLFLGVVHPTLADDDPKLFPQGIKFHRRLAGEPDKDGWYEARSTEGKFIVALPAPFNDFTQTGASRDGGRIVHHVVGTMTPMRVKYLASVIVSTDNKALPESQLAALAAAAAKQGTFKSKRDAVLDGHKGVELHIQEASTAAKMRAFDVAGRRYTLVAEFPLGADGKILEEVDRFLNSLKVDK
jgi:hypothetical protein